MPLIYIQTYAVTAVTLGNLFAWGRGDAGIQGLSDTILRSSPTQVGSFPWTKVETPGMGSNNPLPAACGLHQDGTLFTWGDATNGKLGQGNGAVSRSSPVQVAGSWKQISVGNDHMAGIQTDGTLWTWGGNTTGQLGNNSAFATGGHRSSPIQIGGDTWIDVRAGYNHTIAIKSDGTLWTWGTNGHGQLGKGDILSRSSPVQVNTIGSFTDFIYISCGGGGASVNGYSGAIRSNGNMYTWGSNQNGQLGQFISTVTARSLPVQVVGLWKKIEMSDGSTAALKTDGTLWTWGTNSFGQLALGDLPARSSPVQVGADTWLQANVGGITGMGIRTNGTLWTWGYNGQGQLGQNTLVPGARSSPVQVGVATDWVQAHAGQYAMQAMRFAEPP